MVVSDSAVFTKTKFYHKLMAEDSDLPTPSTLENSEKVAPYVFLGDSAFALHKYVMKPFPLKGIKRQRRIYNYRHCRSRRVVENAFGILASRFRVLLQTLGVNLDAVDSIVLACCALHNYLAQKSRNYTAGTTVDREDVTKSTLIPGDCSSLSYYL